MHLLQKIENFEAECRNLYNQKCQIVKDIKNYEERISSLQNIIHNLDEKVLEYTFLKQKVFFINYLVQNNYSFLNLFIIV